jgi:long-chain fatty acid transport protein
MTRNAAIALAAAIGVVTATSRDAAAAGFSTAHFGGEQGTAVSTNPTDVYFNPGAMGFSEGIHLFVDGDIALRHATWTHTAPPPGKTDQPDSEVGNSGEAKLFNVFAGPALAATGKFGNLAVGFGLFVPFGGRVSWDQAPANPMYPLTAGGVQRWHMLDAQLTFLQISAGLAYRLGPISIGATGSFINSQVNEDEARTQSGNVDTTAEERANINVKGNNGSFGAGIMLEAIPKRLYFGASYQAQPGLGQQDLKGNFTLTAGPAPLYAQHQPLVQPVDFRESLPDVIRAGIAFRVVHDLELRAYGDYTRWSKLTSQCISNQGTGPCLVHPDGSDATPNLTVVANIPRNWKDTYSGHLGVSYFASSDVEVFGGVGYETGAAPDATMEPGAMDGNNIDGSIGGRFNLFNYCYFALSYTQLQFLNRTVTTSALETGANGKPVLLPTMQQEGNGQYTQWVGFVDLNLEKQF